MNNGQADLQDDTGKTPLSWAVMNGRNDLDANAKDNEYGQTPLSWAAQHGREVIVRLPIERDDGGVNAKDKMGGHHCHV
ncbi:hypothetical protein EV426DRAFT_711593 [Tirmania nivea]|nr:hypothetical protein EV426DRAFT_711593 [Tirmania nivea]